MTTTADFLAVDQQAPPTVERCLDCAEPRPLIARGLCTRCYQAWRRQGRELPPTKRLAYAPIEGEKWAQLPGWGEQYWISDCGRVWSEGGLRRQNVSSKGHMFVDLKFEGVRRTRRVHQLVLEAFVGPCPPGLIACHDNGIPADNRLSNLRWDTRSSNQQDTTRHGGWPQMRRAKCPRGHDLMGGNLKPSTLARGRRECWACARANSQVRSDIRAGRTPRDMQEASDRAYAKLMGDPT